LPAYSSFRAETQAQKTNATDCKCFFSILCNVFPLRSASVKIYDETFLSVRSPAAPVPAKRSALGDFSAPIPARLCTAAHLTMLAIEILRLHLPAKRKDTRQLFGIANEALPKLSG
jgi:hypothetical protein